MTITQAQLYGNAREFTGDGSADGQLVPRCECIIATGGMAGTHYSYIPRVGVKDDLVGRLFWPIFMNGTAGAVYVKFWNTSGGLTVLVSESTHVITGFFVTRYNTADGFLYGRLNLHN